MEQTSLATLLLWDMLGATCPSLLVPTPAGIVCHAAYFHLTTISMVMGVHVCNVSQVFDQVY